MSDDITPDMLAAMEAIVRMSEANYESLKSIETALGCMPTMMESLILLLKEMNTELDSISKRLRPGNGGLH